MPAILVLAISLKSIVLQVVLQNKSQLKSFGETILKISRSQGVLLALTFNGVRPLGHMKSYFKFEIDSWYSSKAIALTSWMDGEHF